MAGDRGKPANQCVLLIIAVTCKPNSDLGYCGARDLPVVQFVTTLPPVLIPSVCSGEFDADLAGD
jgi:hypothetical protein